VKKDSFWQHRRFLSENSAAGKTSTLHKTHPNVNLHSRPLDVNQMEKAHLKRLSIETSWLNYTRNAIIGSVSGLALYSSIDVQDKRDLWPCMLMLGAGFTFMTAGTVQYAVSLFAFEASQSMQLWGLLNAALTYSCYSGGLYFFLDHADTKLAKIESERAEEAERAEAESTNSATLALN